MSLFTSEEDFKLKTTYTVMDPSSRPSVIVCSEEEPVKKHEISHTITAYSVTKRSTHEKDEENEVQRDLSTYVTTAGEHNDENNHDRPL